jgi:hypothetical protein
MAKGPFMEFLRAIVTQTAINAYKEVQIPTPTSKTENMAMLIHSIELRPSVLVAAAPATEDFISTHLCKTTQTNVRTTADPDILAIYHAVTNLNAVFHDVLIRGEQKQTFDPPILYPKASLFLGMTTGGMASVKNVTVRVGYTLEKVSREDFISALVE